MTKDPNRAISRKTIRLLFLHGHLFLLPSRFILKGKDDKARHEEKVKAEASA